MAVDDQMEMAMNESGRKDPVSGNDVPMGSLPEEVRDDVPAMLSEGEYVVPADVLRFYGLKFFEDLRENAKMEITRMAEEGRIGGEPVAGPGPTAPTPDQPNGLDLSPDDMQQLESVLQASEGGAVGFNVGGLEQGLDQSEQGGAATQKVSMDMEADAKTDQLIDRIMGAVQKNPSLQQKLAAKGVGFMEGGVVQGYAPGGLSVEDAIKAQSKYATKRFNPFDPNWMLGMSASGLQDPLAGQMYGQMPKPVTSAQLQEDAGVIKPQEQPDGPDDPDAGKVRGYADMTASEVLAFGNFLDKFPGDLRSKWPGQKEAETIALGNISKYSDSKKSKEGLDFTPTTSGGSTTSNIDVDTSDPVGSGGPDVGGGSTSSGQSGASNTADASTGNYADNPDFMGKGGFISRRKKT